MKIVCLLHYLMFEILMLCLLNCFQQIILNKQYKICFCFSHKRTQIPGREVMSINSGMTEEGKKKEFLKQIFSAFLNLLVCMPFASEFWCPEPDGPSQMSLWEHVQDLGACRSVSTETEERPNLCDNDPP